MSQQRWTTVRKISTVCVVATLLGLFLAASNADAGNKKSKPSAQGQANGVAHRVAALEAAVAAQDTRIGDLEDAVLILADAVTELQARVDALEAAAIPVADPAAP